MSCRSDLHSGSRSQPTGHALVGFGKAESTVVVGNVLCRRRVCAQSAGGGWTPSSFSECRQGRPAPFGPDQLAPRAMTLPSSSPLAKSFDFLYPPTYPSSQYLHSISCPCPHTPGDIGYLRRTPLAGCTSDTSLFSKASLAVDQKIWTVQQCLDLPMMIFSFFQDFVVTVFNMFWIDLFVLRCQSTLNPLSVPSRPSGGSSFA